MTLAARSIIELGWVDLAVAAALVLAAGVVSAAMRARLEKRLAVAAVRTAVQLLLIGYVLRWVFANARRFPWTIAIVGFVMIAIASRAAVKRASRRYAGATLLAFATLLSSGVVTTLAVTQLIVGAEPWYAPQYLIPLLGMVLGNCLTGISLCLDHFLESLSLRRGEVETELALGASRWEAARGPLGAAVRRGMIPIINSMMVVGLVSLPGMMTGQILAGADPLTAVKYQIMVMFMLAAGTALGSMLVALLTYRRLFNARHQLLAGQIERQGD